MTTVYPGQKRPYPNPEPRSFSQWCEDLGLACEGNCSDSVEPISYDEFILTPNTKLRKIANTPLYGFWRVHGEAWGEGRTVEEWLKDFNWQIVDPTEEDLNDLNIFMGHDEFWDWSSGKVSEIPEGKWIRFRKRVLDYIWIGLALIIFQMVVTKCF